VAPVKAAEKPYALLAKAMEEQGKVGIARFVMRTKQYLAALRPKDGMIMLSTMVYADELAAPDEIKELQEVADVDVSERELKMASQLIESLSVDFDPTRFKDEYRDRVLGLIEQKAAGEEIRIEAPDAHRQRQGRRPDGRARGLGGRGSRRSQAAPGGQRRLARGCGGRRAGRHRGG
jgi:DNA end-binding protein Ku